MTDTPDPEVERLRAALAEAERLRELSEERSRETVRHLRNVLAVIRALVRRTGDRGEEIEQWRAMLDGRIAAFARIQSNILRSPADGADLENLIRDELLSFGMHPRYLVSIDGPALRLEAGTAGLMALAIHELALSAVNNGGIDGVDTLEIAWSMPEGDGPMQLRWTETAAQPVEASDDAALAWLRDALAYDLDGVLSVTVDGTQRRCAITLPGRSIIAAPVSPAAMPD